MIARNQVGLSMSANRTAHGSEQMIRKDGKEDKGSGAKRNSTEHDLNRWVDRSSAAFGSRF
jgi:hypothetical protein